MMAVTAIHQRLANAVARVGGMVEGKKLKEGPEEKKRREQREERKEQAGSTESLPD